MIQITIGPGRPNCNPIQGAPCTLEDGRSCFTRQHARRGNYSPKSEAESVESRPRVRRFAFHASLAPRSLPPAASIGCVAVRLRWRITL
jgi:hypothetical protein